MFKRVANQVRRIEQDDALLPGGTGDSQSKTRRKRLSLVVILIAMSGSIIFAVALSYAVVGLRFDSARSKMDADLEYARRIMEQQDESLLGLESQLKLAEVEFHSVRQFWFKVCALADSHAEF